jgi:acetoin utilization deacetylase AcuC-like enzyme
MDRPAFVYSPAYTMDWGEHVFHVKKFELLYEKLISEEVVKKEEFLEPSQATLEELKLVHTPRYLSQLEEMTATPEIGYAIFEIPITLEVLNSFKLAAGGSILGAREALRRGRAANLSGGFHHAFSEHGEGFCIINDMAVAVRVMQKEKEISRACIIDCDLHQGNGTARIFRYDESVFTFSIHQEHNYPIKEKSDWDIGLDDFVGDEEYLKIIQEVIPQVLDRSKPDLVIYQCGADPYEKDQLGLLKLTKQGLLRRDQSVIAEVYRRKIPILVVLGGGYPPKIEDVVEIHFNSIKALVDVEGIL